MKSIDLGRGYSVKYDPGRQGGLGPHYQVYNRGKRIAGIVDPQTGNVLRHAGQDPAVPNRILKQLVKRGWIRSAQDAAEEAAEQAAKRAAIAKAARGGGRALGIIGFILGVLAPNPVH